MIVDKKHKEIISDNSITKKFTSVYHNDLELNCNILNGDFFLDSFNYFPITENLMTFSDTYFWGDINKYSRFFSLDFYEHFKNKKSKFKKLKNLFILGSSSNDNYYRNMITFFPRLFFIKEKKINIAIHRKSSIIFREFLIKVCKNMNIESKLIFLDDEFYEFQDSQIPEFLSIGSSIKILSSLKNNSKNNKNNKNNKKLYISRNNCSFRNLINEGDVIERLKKNGFTAVDLNNYNIFEQIELFSNAETIVGPTGSGMANISFCNPGVKIFEISPSYNFKYEEILKNRYSEIAKHLNLKHSRLIADPVELNRKETKKSQNLSKEIISKSNYYKDLIIKIDSLDVIFKS